MSIIRSQHWIDVAPDPFKKSRRIRKFKKYANYRTPNTSWNTTDDSDIDAVTKIPNNWQGKFEFTHRAEKGPLQVYFGDSSDITNTALVGMRSAENPSSWINFKALNVNQVAPVLQKANRRVIWPNLWTNTHLIYRYTGEKLDKLIYLSSPGHPASFRFAMRIPNGHTYEVSDNKIIIRDENGNQDLITHPVIGWDSSTTYLSPTGTMPIAATLTEDSPITVAGKQFPTFRITPNPDDLDIATYPITIDPSVEVSGTPTLEDTYLNRSGSIAFRANYGTCIQCQCGNEDSTLTKATRSLLRIDLSSIAAPVIVNSFTMNVKRVARDPGLISGGTFYGYRIHEVNEWFCTGSCNTNIAGYSSWDYTVNNSVSWAGSSATGGDLSAGCGVAGTDYYTGDECTKTYIQQNITAWDDSIELTPSWAEGWINGTLNNNGILFKGTEDSNDFNNFGWWSQESTTPSYRWTVTVDYTWPDSHKKVMMLA